MRTEPILLILTLLAAVLVGLEQVAIPAPWGTVVKVVSVALAAVLARSQVFSQASTQKLVTTALETPTPPSKVETEARAAEIVGSPP